MPRFIHFSILLGIFLTACGVQSPSRTIATHIITASPTLVLTLTSITTSIPITPDPTPTATEFPKINEYDLKPNYTETVSQEFMGVQINASLITDKSLDPNIKKVTVGEAAYAEFMARTIFKVWWSKGAEKHVGTPTEQDFTDFMALWAKAQETNDSADWEKVALYNVWANDMEDGNGYVQAPYTIWPMYSDGQTPEGVRGIEKMSVAVVKTQKMRNITAFQENIYTMGFGSNIKGNAFYVYEGVLQMGFTPNKDSLASLIAVTSVWLNINSGTNLSGYPSWGDETLRDLLYDNMTVI